MSSPSPKTSPIDPVALSQALIRVPSVTPDQGDCLNVLKDALEGMGFTCHMLLMQTDGAEDVMNLYARYGTGGKNFCFAGHTDVVPVGVEDHWTKAPFGAEIKDGILYGRGASDMKAAIACFTAAASRIIASDFMNGHSLSFLITGDEEGPAINGTKRVLDWLVDQGEKLDLCLVGEPTNPHQLGEMMKIGRRGSLHGYLTAKGTQGHVAYPHLAHNPIPDLVKLLSHLEGALDDGNNHFQPSNLEVVKISATNDSDNIIPGEAKAQFNVRFSSEFTPEALKDHLTHRLDKAATPYQIDWWVSGDSFLTQPGILTDAITKACEKYLGKTPELSTTGGTSDARFIKNMCPVVEFGLVGATMHKVNESCAVDDIHMLTDIYTDIIQYIFKES